MVKYRNPRHEQEAQELDELENEQTFMNEPAVSAEEEVWKKRYGDQQRYLNQVKADVKTQVEDLQRKLDQALRGQIKAPKSDEDVEAWVKQYPEFSGILETIIQKRVNEATSRADAKIAEIKNKQEELDAQKAFFELRDLHKDLDKILAKDSDFRKWLGRQSQKLQDKMNSLDVDEASLVIDKYKSEKKSSKPSKVEDEDFSGSAARNVRTSTIVEEPNFDGEYEFTESQIERESKSNRRWYEANEEKIMDAARRGKILYDLSGGAR